jgi:hypothetical protein
MGIYFPCPEWATVQILENWEDLAHSSTAGSAQAAGVTRRIERVLEAVKWFGAGVGR